MRSENSKARSEAGPCSASQLPAMTSNCRAAMDSERVASTRSSSLQSGGSACSGFRLHRRCRSRLVIDGNAMTIDHLPAFPTREQQDADHDRGTYQTDRNDCAGAISIPLIETEELDENRDHVADRM